MLSKPRFQGVIARFEPITKCLQSAVNQSVEAVNLATADEGN